MNNAILDKIRKLQALADNAGTEHEAALAAQRVAELCRAHNLEIGAIALEQEEREATEIRYEHKGSYQSYWGMLATACGDLFGVGLYRSKAAHISRDMFGQIKAAKDTPVIVFYGLRASVESARVTYQYFVASTEAMLEGYIRGGARPGVSQMRDFRIGCAARICEESKKVAAAARAQLAAAPAEVQQQTAALVRLENNLVRAHAAKLHLRAGRSVRASGGDAYRAGYAAGGRVDLHGARSSRMLA